MDHWLFQSGALGALLDGVVSWPFETTLLMADASRAVVESTGFSLDVLPLSVLFSLGNLLVMPFWALMILAPGWSGTRRVLGSALVSIGPAVIYALLVLPSLPSLLGMLMRPTLPAVAALLGTPRGATVGWVHFLAFDLLVGRRVYLDARERGVPAWVSSPVLFLVLMLGPLGWLVHLPLWRHFAVVSTGTGQASGRR